MESSPEAVRKAEARTTGTPPAIYSSRDAEIFAGELDPVADMTNCEPDGEPAPAPLELAVVSRQRVAEDEAQVRTLAASVSAMSARLREVPATVTKMQERRKHVLNWVKSIADTLDNEDKRHKYTDVMVYLNKHEQGCDQMVLRSSDVANLCQQMRKAMEGILSKVTMNYDVGGSSSGSLAGKSLLDTWNPQLVELELQMVEQLSKELAASYGDLQSMTGGENLSSCNAAIQSLENEMYAVDALGEAKEHLQRAQQWKKVMHEKREERATDEAALGVLEASVKDCQGKIRTQKSFVQEVEKRLEELQQRQKELKKSVNMKREEAISGLKNLKEDAQKQIERLQKLKEAQLVEKESHFNEAHQQYQRKLQTLEAELFDTDKHVVNHIVFCLDHSYSMSGQRWQAALRALESFRTVRLEQGSQDVVSLVVFNHEPKQILVGKPLTLDFVAELRAKVKPNGGTCYAPAWREVMKCTEYVQWGSRLIVVFITDGFANDIPQATEVARELHRQQSSRGGMNTFVVNIDKEVADDVLEPLVKAGNGSQTKLRAFGEATRLLASVATGDMMSHFQRLANLIDAREVCMKHRIGLVLAAEEEVKKQQLDSVRLLEEQVELRVQSLRESCARAEKENESDVKHVRAMLEDQLRDVVQEHTDLQDSLDKESTRLRDLESSLAEYENKVKMQKLHLEDTAKVAEEEIKALGKCHEATAANLDRLKMTQEKLQHNFGSSDFETLQKRLNELDDLKRLCKINHFQSRDQANEVGSLQRFFALVCDRIREPLGGKDLRLACKAGFVFARLLPERGVVLKKTEQPDSAVGLQRYFEQEAKNMDVEACDSKKAMKLFSACDVKSEDLCAACEKENADEVEQAKKEIEKRLEEKLFESKGVGKQGKLQEKMKKLKTKKEEMEEDLPDGWELAEDDSAVVKKREKLERLQEQIQDLEGQLDDQKADLRELAEFVLLKRLVRRAMDDCRSTYRKHLQRQTLQNLWSVFHNYNENVHQPMHELVATVGAVRAAYCIEGPTNVTTSRLENGGSSDMC